MSTIGRSTHRESNGCFVAKALAMDGWSPLQSCRAFERERLPPDQRKRINNKDLKQDEMYAQHLTSRDNLDGALPMSHHNEPTKVSICWSARSRSRTSTKVERQTSASCRIVFTPRADTYVDALGLGHGNGSDGANVVAMCAMKEEVSCLVSVWDRAFFTELAKATHTGSISGGEAHASRQGMNA